MTTVVMDKEWRFEKTLGEDPKGILYYGSASNSKRNHFLHYMIDNDFNLWMGIESAKGITFEHFPQELAMDLLYNYNILSCFYVRDILASHGRIA